MLIKVKVTPNSKTQSIEKISPELFSEEGYDSFYLVKLKAPPEGGKANLELIKALNHYFGKEVKIKSGFTSKMKVIEIL